MNETDYINATNLAKARIANNVLVDILPMGDEQTKIRLEAIAAIGKLIYDLEKKVSSK